MKSGAPASSLNVRFPPIAAISGIAVLSTHCRHEETMRICRVRWPYPFTPQLGRGLPYNCTEGQVMFDDRVKAKFPIGMCEADLIAELRGQGFRINQGGPPCKSAFISRGIIIRTFWSVRWFAKADRIDKIWGVYGVIAP